MALGLFQILFMVGKGYLRPDITRCRSDTPKQFKRILQDCVHFAREDRPLFPQVSLVIMNCCFLSLLLAFHFSEVDWLLKSFGKTAFLTKVWAFQFLIMMISRRSAEGGLGERKTSRPTDGWCKEMQAYLTSNYSQTWFRLVCYLLHAARATIFQIMHVPFPFSTNHLFEKSGGIFK